MNPFNEDGSWRTDTHVYDGVKFPWFVPRTSLEAMQSFEVSPDDVWICTYSKSVIFGEWPAHVLHWWKKRDENNVLFLKYEDMKKDLVGTVRMVCKFLGKSLTDEQINFVAQQCTFDAMKKKKTRDNLCVITPYVRKGKVGGWKESFTVAQSEEMVKWYHQAIDGTGLSFQF
ncbi:sulfotransferase 1C2A-like [Saccoglossus kowalevskii]